MIEEMNQPDKPADQQTSDAEDDFDRAVKQMKAALRHYWQEDHGVSGSGAPLKRQDAARNVLATGTVRTRGGSTKIPVTLKDHRGRAELMLRGIEVISREVGHLSSRFVDQLLRSSDPRLLVGLARASLEDTPIDRVDRMALKGAERFQSLLEDAGGSVSSRWVADFLGLNQEAVRKRVRRGGLIARRTTSGELSFPRFQFDEGNAQVLPGLSKLLAKTQSWAPEELIRFLLVRHEPASSDDTPLTLIKRGEIDQVLELARVNLQQRA